MIRLEPARLSRPRAGYLDLDLPSGRSQSAQGDLRERRGRDQVLLQSRPGYRVSASASSKDLPGSRRGRMRPDPIDSPAAFVDKRLDGQLELFLERATNGATHGVRLPASRERHFVTGRITGKTSVQSRPPVPPSIQPDLYASRTRKKATPACMRRSSILPRGRASRTGLAQQAGTTQASHPREGEQSLLAGLLVGAGAKPSVCLMAARRAIATATTSHSRRVSTDRQTPDSGSMSRPWKSSGRWNRPSAGSSAIRRGWPRP
jgi:hypothetical protein